MLKFALNLSVFARGKVRIYNLIVDGVDQFIAFENSLEDKHQSQFRSLAATISQISENKKPPARNKRRKIKGVDSAAEIKTRNLRLYYLIIKEHDLVICIGGTKKTQKKDIDHLKNLRKEIINQIEKNGRLEIKEQKDQSD